MAFHLNAVILIFCTLSALCHAQLNPVQQSLKTFDCHEGDKSACIDVLLQDGYLESDLDFKDELQHALTEFEKPCNTGDQASCARYGLALLASSQNPSDYPKAFDLLSRSCDQGIGWSCSHITRSIDFMEWEPPKASSPLAKAFDDYYQSLAPLCKKGDATACANMGRLNPLLTTVIVNKAIWHGKLVEACDAKLARACAHLGYLYSGDADDFFTSALFPPDSTGTIERINKRKSNRYARKGCLLGNAIGCYNYAIGFDSQTDESWIREQSYYTQACRGGANEGCNDLNWDTYWDETDSVSTLTEPCQLGDFTACAYLAQKQLKPFSVIQKQPKGEDLKNTLAAVEQYQKICEMGSIVACGWVAAILFDPNTPSKTGERMAYGGCETEVSDGNACHFLGLHYEYHHNEKNHNELALHYYSLACELDEPKACAAAGYLYQNGKGTEPSKSVAARFYDRGCNMNNRRSCHLLARLIESDEPERAKSLYEKACSLSPNKSCDHSVK